MFFLYFFHSFDVHPLRETVMTARASDFRNIGKIVLFLCTTDTEITMHHGNIYCR